MRFLGVPARQSLRTSLISTIVTSRYAIDPEGRWPLCQRRQGGMVLRKSPRQGGMVLRRIGVRGPDQLRTNRTTRFARSAQRKKPDTAVRFRRESVDRVVAIRSKPL